MRRFCCDGTIDSNRLKSLFSYEPETGRFTRIKYLRGNAIGPVNGYIDSDGYVILKVDYKNRKAHRLAWLYVHGEWPAGVIDHINGVKTDNRIANLRDTTQAINAQNQIAPMPANKLGVRGVVKMRGKFNASIMTNGVRLFLGSFADLVEAKATYSEAKTKMHAGGRNG